MGGLCRFGRDGCRGTCDAYVNIAGGIKINEPALDLGIVMAIVSSYKNRPIEEGTIIFGEVGLSGEVRAVSMPEQRVAEAKKLGFRTCIMPSVSVESVKNIQGIKIIGVCAASAKSWMKRQMFHQVSGNILNTWAATKIYAHQRA